MIKYSDNIRYFFVLLIMALSLILLYLRLRRFSRGVSGQWLGYVKRLLRTRLSVLLASFFMCLTLLGWITSYEDVKVPQMTQTLYLVIDQSLSMNADDLKPSRFEWSKRKIKDLVQSKSDVNFALVGFSDYPYILVPSTPDRETLLRFLDELTLVDKENAGSEIGYALEFVAQLDAEKSEEANTAIIFTDGGDVDTLENSTVKKVENQKLRTYFWQMATKEGSPVRKSNGEFIREDDKIIFSKLNDNFFNEVKSKMNAKLIPFSMQGDDLVQFENEFNDALKKKGEGVSRRENFLIWPFLLISVFILILDMYGASLAIPHQHKVSLKNKNTTLIVLLFLTLSCLFTLSVKAQEQNQTHDKENSKTFEITPSFLLNEEQKAINAGNHAYRQGDFKTALEYYNDSHTADKKLNFDSQFNAGNAYFRLKQYEEAIKKYEESLKLDPQNQSAQDNLALARQRFQEQSKSDQEKSADKNKDQNDDKSKSQQSDDSEQSKQSEDSEKQDEKSADPNSSDQSQNSQSSKEQSQAKEDKMSEESAQEDTPSPQDKNQSSQESAPQSSSSDKPKDDENKSTQTENENSEPKDESDKNEQNQRADSKANEQNQMKNQNPDDSQKDDDSNQMPSSQSSNPANGLNQTQALQWLQSLNDSPQQAIQSLIEAQRPKNQEHQPSSSSDKRSKW